MPTRRLADLPEEIAAAIAGLARGPLLASATGTTTCRIGGASACYYLKFGPCDGANPVGDEADRLHWLGSAGVPAPRPIHYGEQHGTGYLLMTALSGRPAAEVLADVTNAVTALADALRELHGLSLPCPFPAPSDTRLARAETRLRCGHIDRAAFEAENGGLAPKVLLERLWATRPGVEDAVVVHGDATPDNILTEHGRVTGFVDVGRLGVSDRHCDLAIMTRSLRNRVSAAAAERFLDSYGREVIDAERLTWYRLLDEFF